jgi:hypothetical protein
MVPHDGASRNSTLAYPGAGRLIENHLDSIDRVGASRIGRAGPEPQPWHGPRAVCARSP